jgi:hypothetical protein
VKAAILRRSPSCKFFKSSYLCKANCFHLFYPCVGETLEHLYPVSTNVLIVSGQALNAHSSCHRLLHCLIEVVELLYG